MMSRGRVLVVITVLVLVAACGPTGDRVEGVRGRSPSPTMADTTPLTSPSTTTAPTTTTTEPPARSVTLAFTGDLLLHNRVTALAAGHAADDPDRDYDYRPLLEPIRPWIEGADWAICHLEVNLSADNTRLEPFPTFRSPGQIAADVHDLGYDSCSVASNHILDQGPTGVTETLEVLDAAGLGTSGAARSEQEAADQIWIEVASIRIAHLSYAYGFNGFQIPADAPWLTNLIDEADIIADAARARARGADLVILSLHWGEQYVNQPNWQQREIGPRLLASPDIDLVIGHHAHVVQPIDHLDGEWLVHGLGNLLANATLPYRRDELLVRVSFTEQADGGFSSTLVAVPLLVDQATLTVYPSNPAAREPGTDPTLAAELDASWGRVVAVLQEGSGWTELEVS